MRLKLHTDLELLKLGNPVDLLIPFIGLGNEEYSAGRLYARTFDNYCEHAHEFIELTSAQDCDAYLLPIIYSDSILCQDVDSYIDASKTNKKKIFIFLGHDVRINNINIENAIIFSGAIDKSKQQNNVYSYPHFFPDLLAYNNTPFTTKEKANIPTVGFCGYAPPLGIDFGKDKFISILKLLANYTGLLKIFPNRIAHSWRARAIISLKNSKKIRQNFKIKNSFAFGPNGQLNTGNTTESDVEFRKNFINNILESDYTLCVRGIGNNSIRFFETLCCGRIPVFVNTDSALPFDHLIDWTKLCVWVEEKDISDMDVIIQKFHQNISLDDYQNLQVHLRYLWLEYLSPLGFYKNLSKYI